MAWSTPMTAVSNATFTAAQFNTSVRDLFLETGPAKITAAGQFLVGSGVNALAARTPNRFTNATSQSTASLTYVDLATTGPAYTVTTGTSALVFVTAAIANSVAGGGGLMSIGVSGATTIAPSDDRGVRLISEAAGSFNRATVMHHQIGLTAGSNTFTAKYQAVIGGTASFAFREIAVFPL